jgi:hypothetical protein
METIAHTTPRSLEVLTEHVRQVAPCTWCGARAGKRCGIHGRGEHLSRFIRALVLGEITVDEMAAVIGPLEVFRGATIIRAGAR